MQYQERQPPLGQQCVDVAVVVNIGRSFCSVLYSRRPSPTIESLADIGSIPASHIVTSLSGVTPRSSRSGLLANTKMRWRTLRGLMGRRCRLTSRKNWWAGTGLHRRHRDFQSAKTRVRRCAASSITTTSRAESDDASILPVLGLVGRNARN